MADPIVYDKAKWHFESDDFPSELARQQAFVHTGLFLGWLIDHDLLGAQWREDFEDLEQAFKARVKTGPEVFRLMGGSLTSDDLPDKGNEFAEVYFDFETGVYLDDYDELLSDGLPSMYHVADTWENYDRLAQRISARYAEWREGALPRKHKDPTRE